MGKPKKSRGQSVKSSFLTVGTGEILGQVAVVARGTIIVRMIGLEEMGIVATLLILVEFLNRMANLNPSITMVQDRHGASRGFRHTLQSILLLRGVLFFVVLSLLAWPLSIYYQQEPYVAGFFAVALIPLLSSMVHVDVWRQLKKREYKPQAILSAAPKVGSLVVTAIACIWIQSFWLPIIARIAGALRMQGGGTTVNPHRQPPQSTLRSLKAGEAADRRVWMPKTVLLLHLEEHSHCFKHCGIL